MSRVKKIILSTGGTGGHLFPAEALASDLISYSGYEILFVGGNLSKNAFFDRKKFSYEEICCATISLSHPFQTLLKGASLCKGIGQSWKILSTFQPDLVIGFGSYYTFPLLMAAFLKRIPLILHEQNVFPGKVNRLFSPWAKVTAVGYAQSISFLKGKGQEVLFPKRKACSGSPEEYFQLQSGRLTLFVCGGSQGAKALNDLFLESLPQLIQKLPPFQVLHLTGKNKDEKGVKKVYDSLKVKHCVKAFENDMAKAWHIADLAICRSGAATIAELIETATPALLIPFPFASENHQEKNALHFVSHVGGGKYLLQKNLNKNHFIKTIEEMVQERMQNKRNIEGYKQKRSSVSFLTLVKNYLTTEKPNHNIDNNSKNKT